MASPVPDLQQVPTDTESSEMFDLPEQLTLPPKPFLQILGTHTLTENDEVEIVTDFDIWIDCSGKPVIISGELKINNSPNGHSWHLSRSDFDSDSSFLDVLQPRLETDFSDTGDENEWILYKIVALAQSEQTRISDQVDRVVRSTAYGGTIKVVFHTPITQVKVPPCTQPTSQNEGQNQVEAKVHWNFLWPFTDTNVPWDQIIANAIVDRKIGQISAGQPKKYGVASPVRRDIKAGNTSHTTLGTMSGVTRSIVTHEKWGCDESFN
ncbi:hypothetical protein BDV25DRAFT_15962 [Aspergillus avenaceus]|uniref:Uncharacterized protein n=1 Tax=Aspergillus avenaceus TaxID=36643 RepID=A0A5N6TQF7_ASPAV|nr:hypothetical protein BDV25DRAFT_15962 [Aspergillus avenaceus]